MPLLVKAQWVRQIIGILCLTLLSVLLLSAPLEAQGRDPRLSWHTFYTKHTAIHYHDPLKAVAKRVADIAEHAHTVLAPLIDHRPRERTHFVVNDLSDNANGFARILPYNLINIFVTAPSDISTLSDYDDWLATLVIHEYTHILHIDKIGGLPKAINRVLGKVYTPNQLQPRWFTEGLATLEESERTSGGRLRSSMFDMFWRMDALNDNLPGIDQLSHVADRWPHGTLWYLYGVHFIDFIQSRYGHDALRKMAYHYGRQAIPYGLNRIAKRATGKTFTTLYREFTKTLKEDAQAQRKRVLARGQRGGRRLTHHGESVLSPRFINEHEVVYSVTDREHLPYVRRISLRDPSQNKILIRALGETYLTHDRTRGAIYHSRLTPWRDIYRLNDLHRYDLKTDSYARLTKGMRAEQPDVSADGKKIAFVVNHASTRHLMIAQPEDINGTQHLLLRNRRFDQIYTPRFSPRDPQLLAYSVWRKGGYRDIEIIHLKSRRIMRITHDRALDTGPAWSPDGQWLYFSSDRTGIPNIYAFHLPSQKLMQVTELVSGAYQPDISPSGKTMVYLGYTTKGFDLFVMPLDPSAFKAAPAYQDMRTEDVQPLAFNLAEPLKTERYNPFKTLYPRSYNLEITNNTFGSELGITTTGSDAAEFHRYRARLGIGLQRGEVNADLSWTWLHLLTPLTFRFFRQVNERNDLIVSDRRHPWVEQIMGGSIDASYTFLRRLHAHSIGLNYSISHLGRAEDVSIPLDPNTSPPLLPDEGLFAGVEARWSVSDIRRQVYNISPSYGRRVALRVNWNDPIFGSRWRTVAFQWSGTHYFLMPWLHNHVVAARYAGGLSIGSLGRRRTFAVGGFPDTDLLDAILDNILLGGVALRGYRPGSRRGDQFHLGQLEYRFPIYRLQHGLATLPVYINRFYANVFADYGDAFSGRLDFGEFRLGTGAELLTDFTLGYFSQLTLRLGFAYGFNAGGGPRFYFNLGTPF